MDDVSGVPRMWICFQKTWYVIERPGTFVAPLNVKTTLNVKTAKCEKPNNR